jgi:glycerol-3-phosphate dehydrogenase
MTERSPEDGLRMAHGFLAGAARRRAAAVGPDQARQEALALASIRAELGAAPAGPDPRQDDPEAEAWR